MVVANKYAEHVWINGKWERIGDPKSVKEAPIDGKQYVRKDGTWEEVEIDDTFVREAPIDGKPYVRFNGNWIRMIPVTIDEIKKMFDKHRPTPTPPYCSSYYYGMDGYYDDELKGYIVGIGIMDDFENYLLDV